MMITGSSVSLTANDRTSFCFNHSCQAVAFCQAVKFDTFGRNQKVLGTYKCAINTKQCLLTQV